MTPRDYAMVTVKLGKPAMERKEAFNEIKQKLNLKAPAIDEDYGAIPMGAKDEYVVLIDKPVAEKMKEDKHPNVVGVFSNPKMDTFAGKKPRRKNPPFMSGPCF